jgi:hypothetical protein
MNHQSNNQHEEAQEIQVQMPPEVQRGAYANQMMIAHTQEEFVLDFILATPPVGVVNARVLVSPSHAKRIAAAMQENVARYEAVHGEIKPVSATGIPDHIKIN